MLLKRLASTLIVGGFCVAGALHAADIIVKERPPRIVVEKRGKRPGRDYVWLPGYYRWEGNRYIWEKGRWDRPPRAHARWIAPRWEHRRDGYVFIEGHWS